MRLNPLLTFVLLYPIGLAWGVDNDQAVTRTMPVNTIVLHAIGGPTCTNNTVAYSSIGGDANRWKKFFERHKVLSIHYLIDRNGVVASSIDEDRIANHALGYNPRSIGIELINRGDGNEAYTRQQLDALRLLVNDIRSRHQGIAKSNIVRHSDIDARTFRCAGRDNKLKIDPGAAFPYNAFIKTLK